MLSLASPLFLATVFSSAFLLFFVQPMFARKVLPLYGGTPAVWNTALVFFQAALLAGYLYAHMTDRWLASSRQVAGHLTVLVLALATLPIAVGAEAPAVDRHPALSLIWTMVIGVGLPFFALSANAPLLQGWFSRTLHPAARDPYFFYAASNAGSMLGLLAYPFVIEPQLALREQAWLWTAGFAALVALIAAAGLVAWRLTPAGSEVTADHTDDGVRLTPITWSLRARWIVLSAVPSSLLLGVTSYLSTDIAAVPLLWVIPLSLYLLTFIIVFARRPPVSHAIVLRLQPIFLAVLAILFGVKGYLWLSAPLHLLVFVATALMCHGELARLRPSSRQGTEFYLYLSLGGVLGGAFTAFVAPVAFPAVWEYPLALALACALRPAKGEASVRARMLDLALPAALALALVLPVTIPLSPTLKFYVVTLPSLVLLAILLVSFTERPVRLALATLAVLVLFTPGGAVNESRLLQARSFFGVYSVADWNAGTMRTFRHGTTTHGIQAIDPARSRTPLAYYSGDGPLGQAFVARHLVGATREVGVVGLGVGAAACYAREGETWTFFEIDPLVVEIARDSGLFTYLSQCTPTAAMVVGDARLTLQRERAGRYDMLVLDAFSSDTIPVHLLTREAFAIYLAKLAPGGVIAFHISNRYLNLAPVVARLAADAGLSLRLQSHTGRAPGISSSLWAVMARSDADLGPIADDPRWQRHEVHDGTRLWTDDYSNIWMMLR